MCAIFHHLHGFFSSSSSSVRFQFFIWYNNNINHKNIAATSWMNHIQYKQHKAQKQTRKQSKANKKQREWVRNSGRWTRIRDKHDDDDDDDVQKHKGKVERTFLFLSLYIYVFYSIIETYKHCTYDDDDMYICIPTLSLSPWALFCTLRLCVVYACANFRQSIKLRVVHHLLHLCKHQFSANLSIIHSLVPQNIHTHSVSLALFFLATHLNFTWTNPFVRTRTVFFICLFVCSMGKLVYVHTLEGL